MSTPISHLSEISACSDAVAWVESTKCRSLESAWKKCERGNWMLWYAAKKAGPVGDERRKKLVLAACGCARLSLPIYEKRNPDDKRVRDCIETAEKWERNEATLEALQVSRRNCYAAYAAAAYAAYASSEAYASAAASYAVHVAAGLAYASSEAYASAAASYAAYAAAGLASASSEAYASAAASYAAASAYASARTATLKKCAEIVRKHYPELPA